LIMTGGPTSFGAGGWIGSQLEQAMPIRCEPPQTRNLPRGALALIMHSCEMPEGNYWGQEVAGAAVEALSEQDFIGIVEYSWNSGTNANCDWTLPMQLAGDKVAAMDAVHSLTLGDMQDFDSALELSLEGLNGVDAAQRHVIIISDGDPQPPTQELIQSYRDASVTISTVMVGGHGSPMDLQMMQGIATATGGRFYMVNDPTQLPQIFIKEAQLNSRSLIQEGGPWDPSHIPSGTGPLQGINSIPPITGLVVTAGRGGLSQTPWVINSSDGDDPLYAWWHHGIGKSIAFTSDLGSQWTTQWPAWSSFAPFWQRSIQWAMRGSMPPNVMVRSRVEGGRGIVDIEAVDANASFLNLMQSHAVAIDPHGQSHVISVRQTGPGHYHAEFDMDQSGAWLVNVALQSADGDSTGAIPAAVSIPYPAEYSATTDNAVLLHELAQRTGGRMLSFDEIDSRNLFDREGLELPVSPKPVWDLLAILAASLLIIDIAIRRLWIDRKSMQTMLAPVAQATTSSVEALRRVHEQQEREQPKKEQPENVSPESPKEPSSTPKQEEQIERDDNLGKLLKRKRDRGDQGGDS
ncbi:MAG TPA: VWA domain-containing protein, partial [Phycisphaerales bacterium]|nr:VWA domain-containing protein [Phycisphaerales bacterium]